MRLGGPVVKQVTFDVGGAVFFFWIDSSEVGLLFGSQRRERRAFSSSAD